MRRIVPSVLCFVQLALNAMANGFIEEVACSSDGLTITMNKWDPDLARMLNNSKASPVVYVYGHKDRVNCGTVLKNEKGDINLNLTVPYGITCDVHLANLEPNFKTSEMGVALEDYNDKTRTPILNHAFCLYTKSVQTFKFNDVNTAQQITHSTGGRPKPKVDMLFRNLKGEHLRTARIGDTLQFYLTLVPDNTYKAILPKECLFSDQEDMQAPSTKKVTFVQNSCPVNDFADVIEPLAHVHQEVFFSTFKTFRFDDKKTVFVHCTVQVCLTLEECHQSCFKSIDNSNLTAERVRFRHRRELPIGGAMHNSRTTQHGHAGELETIHQTLEVLPKEEWRNGASSLSECPSPLESAKTEVLAFGLALVVVCAISLATIAYLLHRLKRANKESSFDLYSTTTFQSLAASSASGIDYVERPPAGGCARPVLHPLHVHTVPSSSSAPLHSYR